MTTRRLTPVAVLLAAVLAMGAGVARAQETVRIAIASNVNAPGGVDFIAVTGITNGTLAFSSNCMKDNGFAEEHPVVTGVAVDSDDPPAARQIPIVLQTALKPGTRLTTLKLVATCTETGAIYRVFEATIASPQNIGIAYVITPSDVTFTEDHEGVVGGGTNEFDIADVVFVKQGSPTIKTALISDIPLAAGDRLTGFVELDYDPETGETLYGCWVEY